MNDDPLAIAAAIGAAVEEAGGRWVVGGSVASSVHGVPRTTRDIDVIVALTPSQVPGLARAAAGFLIDDDALADQLRAGRAYNVFHAETMTKIDLFPAVGRFERSQLARAVRVAGARILSAEDVVLAKLRWYRAGGEISERQWTDVVGVCAIQRGRLDWAYLETWAVELDVAELLHRARADESGGF